MTTLHKMITQLFRIIRWRLSEMLTYRTATETVMSKFFAKFSGKWTWHVLPSHPSGFNKHIGIWHHSPYRFTSVYRQNGNQVVIVVVWQWFLRNWKPSGSIQYSYKSRKPSSRTNIERKQAQTSYTLSKYRCNDNLSRRHGIWHTFDKLSGQVLSVQFVS